MPAAERSRATGRVMPTTPPLEAEYDAWPIWPSKAATEARLTIAPRWPSASGSLRLITVAAWRVMSKVPMRLISTTLRKASRSCACSSSPSRPMVRCAQPMPAEFTHARSGAISAAASTAAATWSVFVTSTEAKTPPISAASASPFSALRSATTTTAPLAARARATAAPMPLAPPVTMAVDPVMSMIRIVEPGLGTAVRGFVPQPRGQATWSSPPVDLVPRSTLLASHVGDALGDEHGGAGHQHPVVLGPHHVQRAAGDVHAVRRPAGRVVGQRRGDGHRARAGAARAGLPRPALVDAHRDVTLAAAHHELDVDTLGVDRVVVLRRLDERARLGQVVDVGHGVRVAHRDVERRPRPPHHRHLGLAQHLGRAHVGGVLVAGPVEDLHPGAGPDAHREGLALALVEVAREDPDAVAAHLADRPVGVAVVHEPRVALTDRPQHPVAADARAPVAQRAHALLGQVAVERAVGVGQHHEVVLRAVALEEGVAHPRKCPTPTGS